MHRRKRVVLLVTPAGTFNELDVQNKWEENTHTYIPTLCNYNIVLITVYRIPSVDLLR